jgi:hypothetical protein
MVAGVDRTPCWLTPRKPGQLEVDVVSVTGTEELLPVVTVSKAVDAKLGDWPI